MTREAALEIALRYLGTQYAGRITVESLKDQVDPSWTLYRHWEANAAWYLIVPDLSPRIGGSRLVAIDKETGRILADQWVGE